MELNLKLLRKQENKTQEEISKYLNITRATYNGYELKRCEPNIDTLCKLADYYNVSVDYLIGRHNKYDIGYLNEQQRTAIELIKELTPLHLAKTIGYMGGLIVNQK